VLGNDQIRQVACAGRQTRKRCCKSRAGTAFCAAAPAAERRAPAQMTPTRTGDIQRFGTISRARRRRGHRLASRRCQT